MEESWEGLAEVFDREALIARLVEENEEFRRLREEHQGYERELDELNARPFLSADQQWRISEVKKLKLMAKDRMEAVIRQANRPRSSRELLPEAARQAAAEVAAVAWERYVEWQGERLSEVVRSAVREEMEGQQRQLEERLAEIERRLQVRAEEYFSGREKVRERPPAERARAGGVRDYLGALFPS